MFALNTDPFAWTVIAGLIALMAIRAPYEKARQANVYTHDGYTWDEKILILLVFIGMVLIPALNLFVRLADPFDWNLPPVLARMTGGAGAITLAFALWLFWRSHADLGRNWSPSLQIREQHTLVTTGVYARMRHPMYAAIWLLGIAQALLLQNWITSPACLASFLPMHLIRIPREEAMLRAQFGAAWDDFARTRGGVTPWF